MLIALLLFLFSKEILTQVTTCPQNQKMSKTLPGSCIPSTVHCDGFYFDRVNPYTCLQKNPSTTPQIFGQPSISCALAQTSENQEAVYFCKNCTDPNKPFIISTFSQIIMECIGCKEDEYLFTAIPPFKCIKKLDFGRSYTNGFISEDFKSIVSKCEPNQILSDLNVMIQNKKVVLKRCVTCKNLASSDLSECIDFCNLGEIKDVRNTQSLRCIKWQSCNLISEDALSCVTQCNSDEVQVQLTPSVKICKKCSGKKPYLSVDKSQCVSECGSGNVYSEELLKCIVLSDCVDFVNKGFCTKTDCTIKTNPRTKPDAVIIPSPMGTKYKLCSECPETTPFAIKTNPLVCGDCSTQPDTRSQSQNMQPRIVCRDKYIECCSSTKTPYRMEYIMGLLSYDERMVYKNEWCPPGQAKQDSSKSPYTQYKCSLCPNKEFSLQSFYNKCCLNGQFLTEFYFCVDVCENEVRSDLTCAGRTEGCQKEEILKQVEHAYKDLNQRDQRKTIKQCLSCEDSKLKLEDFTSLIWEMQQIYWRCYIFFLSSQNLQLQATPIANKLQTFPPFQYEKGQPAFTNDFITKQCPQDKPFLDYSLKNRLNQLQVCTRCEEKIRDYGTGICYSKIEEIPNLGSGIFSGERRDYWPKRLVDKSQCADSFVNFQYNDMILNECPPSSASSATCGEKNLIFDERASRCVQPELCSTILSNDRKKCSLEKCKPKETFFKFDFNDPQYSKKSNQGYLHWCQVCPSNKQFIYDESCVESCPEGYVFLEADNICFQKHYCFQKYQYYIMSSKKVCGNSCSKSEGFRQDDKTCYSCESSLPYTIDGQCVKECPENTVPNALFQCKDLSTCQGVVNKKRGNVCLKECPFNQYKMPFIDKNKVQTYIFCVDECEERYYKQQDNRQCERSASCKKLIFNQQCVEKCPSGYGKITFPYYEMTYYLSYYQSSENYCVKCSNTKDANSQLNQLYEMDGECLRTCQVNMIADESSFKCIQFEMCKGVISIDSKTCLTQCPLRQIPNSKYLNLPQCEQCPPEKPFVDFVEGRERCVEKCRILDLTASPVKCLKSLQNCAKKIVLQEDGSYTCDYDCPNFMGDKSVCNEEKQCYFECKKCPSNAPLFHQGECVNECPVGYHVLPELNRLCIKECPERHVFALDEQECFSMDEEEEEQEYDEYYVGGQFIQIPKEKQPSPKKLLEGRILLMPSRLVLVKTCPKNQCQNENCITDFFGQKFMVCIQKIGSSSYDESSGKDIENLDISYKNKYIDSADCKSKEELSGVEISILSILIYTIIQCLIIGIYVIIKKIKNKNEKQRQQKTSIADSQKLPSSTTHLQSEDANQNDVA